MAPFKHSSCLLLGSLIALVLCWVAVTQLSLVNTLFVPTPLQVAVALRRLFLQGGFAFDIWASLYRVMVAFSIALLLAVPLALLMSSYRTLDELISPYIDFIRYLPVPTLIPLTILFFGIGEAAKIILLFVGTFFQLILLILNDLSGVRPEYYDLCYTLKCTKWEVLWVKLRAILPQLYNNGRITLGWCWTYVIIAELVASDAGIGHMIKEAQRFSNTPEVYIGVATMGVIGFLTDWLLKRLYPRLFGYQQAKS